MEPWKAVSCFQDVQANKFHHLHPELVDVAESGSTTTTSASAAGNHCRRVRQASFLLQEVLTLDFLAVLKGWKT
jgi:hypothetical protein